MIPEFKFKKRTSYKKASDNKIDIMAMLDDKRTKLAGAVVAGALGISIIAVATAGDGSFGQATTVMAQTAGVTTRINESEQVWQEQMQVANLTMSKLDASKTGASLESAGGFNLAASTGESVEEEDAAEASSAAVLAENSGEAVVADAPEEAEPAHIELVGFSNPGIARVEDYVNIRKTPAEDGEICGKLSNGHGCEILGEENGWYYVITNGVKGYIKADYLVTGEEAWQLADQLKVWYVRVLTETLYVREQPSTESTIVGMLSMDQKVNIMEMQDEWVKILSESDGVVGYINKSYIAIEYTLPKGEAVEAEKKEEKTSKDSTTSKSSKSTSKTTARDCSNVVDYALQFVGNPYVYGGTSLTKGADCSGFTMSVYAKFGVYLPHSSAAQASCGVKVSASELAPGDLIFYGSGSKVNHVAMYIGGGRIVHASTTKTGIKVSNAFYRTPITIRRVMR